MSSQHVEKTGEWLHQLVDHLYLHGGDFKKSRTDADAACASAGINKRTMKEHIAARWNDLVDHALDDDILSKTEENRLTEILEVFDLGSSGADKYGHLSKIVKAATLRDLKEGKVPERFSTDALVPFKLQKKEKLMWYFKRVSLFENVKKRKTVGRSSGTSIRVAKGVYWRYGSFEATPVESNKLEKTDMGEVFLTNKHISFNGERRNFKIRFMSLASIEPFKGGLELQKNTQTAKPFLLSPIDSWFCYNVIQFS